ncbi:hypothetical protein [Kitasatospora kifunensis]|uniref:Uncharacterized protein n=1 Tax=Kitasatospora kifunensis TaxID=58351 RepID=A0A7W7R2T9_KITKI|nr:hypothetical protein [Kitasatospora kifunensis]MBB4924245.1 hypothetical protein [Kitasatospora kifunensis]
MTQPTTAHRAALGTSPAAFPAQRTTAALPRPAARASAAGPTSTVSGWSSLRRGLAIVRGLHSLRSVPARPQPGYGESDGQ